MSDQALRDLLLVYLIRNEVPNVLVLVLHPKGQLRVPDHAHRGASDGVTQLGGRWKVVELWTVPAEPVLAAADPGMMPWVPLMETADPPEVVLRRCREVIDQHVRRYAGLVIADRDAAGGAIDAYALDAADGVETGEHGGGIAAQRGCPNA